MLSLKPTDFQQRFVVAGHGDGFSDHIGPFYQYVADDAADNIRALPIDGRHLNPEGVVHGGVILSFMDYVIYRAIGDVVGHDLKFATINLNSNFLAAAKAGDILYGQGRIVRQTKSVIFAEGSIVSNREVMTASGIWKIISV
ncbi:PaaI family thioesterase [Thalassotalea sp. HSM 43]|nr:PaaI family thioesterase [Thalassotalea sp. HSM 43]